MHAICYGQLITTCSLLLIPWCECFAHQLGLLTLLNAFAFREAYAVLFLFAPLEYMVTSFRPYGIAYFPPAVHHCNEVKHGLRTPNEGMNQRYLKKWADAMWQTKYTSAIPKNLGSGSEFSAVQ